MEDTRQTCRDVAMLCTGHAVKTRQFFLQRAQEPDARAWRGCNRARGSGERGPGGAHTSLLVEQEVGPQRTC